MKRFTVILFCVCSLWSVGIQCKAAYKLKVHRTEVTRYNQEYVVWHLWVTKPNRSIYAVNGKFTIHNLPRDVKVKLRMYEFLSNEYRPFAIDFERNLCSYQRLEYRMLYQEFVKIGAHMPKPECPVPPGNYSFANATPHIDNYPPNLPFHNWLLTIEYWHGKVEIALLKFFGTLDRDAVIREQYT